MSRTRRKFTREFKVMEHAKDRLDNTHEKTQRIVADASDKNRHALVAGGHLGMVDHDNPDQLFRANELDT